MKIFMHGNTIILIISKTNHYELINHSRNNNNNKQLVAKDRAIDNEVTSQRTILQFNSSLVNPNKWTVRPSIVRSIKG